MTITKREWERRTRLNCTLFDLGFNPQEIETLRRASNTLRRWYERECNDEVERDEMTWKALRVNPMSGKRWPTADLETPAIRRISDALKARNARRKGDLLYFLQHDPRGASLYILRPGDIPKGEDPRSYYSRGICVY